MALISTSLPNTFTFNITPVNDAPVAQDDKAAHATEGSVALIEGSVAGNNSDIDDGAVLTFALNDTAPAGLVFNPDGSYTFDPSDPAYDYLAEGQPLEIPVSYTVSDGKGGTDTATLTICFTGTADDAPCACSCHCEPVNLLATNGSFEHPDLTPASTGADWVSTNVDGWTNTGAAEVKSRSGIKPDWLLVPGLRLDGDFVIETDGWGEGNGPLVKDAIQTTVNAEAGQDVELSFNYASRNETAGAGNTTDSFEVYWNGTKVGNFDPSSSASWSTAHISLVGNASGTNTLEIREAGAEDSYGALIDNVKVTSCPPAESSKRCACG